MFRVYRSVDLVIETGNIHFQVGIRYTHILTYKQVDYGLVLILINYETDYFS